MSNFVNKLKNEQHVVGPFMKTGDPAFVEIVGHAGFEFAILDMEHGPVNFLSCKIKYAPPSVWGCFQLCG